MEKKWKWIGNGMEMEKERKWTGNGMHMDANEIEMEWKWNEIEIE